MSYQSKLKLKMFMYNILGILTMALILLISVFFDKLVETIITIILFFIYRSRFEKQYHASSLYLCSFISIIIFTIIIQIEVKLSISILFSVILTYTITLVSYYVRDYLDNRVLVKTYRQKLESFNTRCIENLTEDELIALMPKVRYEIIHIVYGYLHRPKTLNSMGYAYRCNISERTLFRYVKQIKEKYESLGLNS